MAAEERLLVGGREVAIVRDALVEIMRDKVEHVFFEVRAGAADGVNPVSADHFRQRQSQFRLKVGGVTLRCILETSGIKMTEMARNKIATLHPVFPPSSERKPF
jgi:hypothetical protein